MLPTIEFFEGLPEQLENVSLRLNKVTGVRNVLFLFKGLKATERFQSFTKQFYGHKTERKDRRRKFSTPSGIRTHNL